MLILLEMVVLLKLMVFGKYSDLVKLIDEAPCANQSSFDQAQEPEEAFAC